MLIVKRLKDKKNFLIVLVFVDKVSNHIHKDQITETNSVVISLLNC